MLWPNVGHSWQQMPLLTNILNLIPKITFRRAPSLGDHLVRSHFTPVARDDPSYTGTFACGRCDICHYVLNGQEVILLNGHTHSISQRFTCQTVGVIYLAKCKCGCFNVGKTKRPFLKWIKDHTTPIFKRLMTTAVSRHVGLEHDFDTIMIRFTALEHVPAHVRGGNIDFTFLQLETRWIYNLNATSYPGLNKYISFKSF